MKDFGWNNHINNIYDVFLYIIVIHVHVWHIDQYTNAVYRPLFPSRVMYMESTRFLNRHMGNLSDPV